MKKIVIIGVLILAALVGYHFFTASMKNQQHGGAGGPMPVSVAVVQPVGATLTREFSGRFQAVADAEIKPQVGGTIQKILFNEGDTVKAGQPLFLIDPRAYRAELQQAQASAAEASAALERGQTLYQTGAISKREIESRTATAARAQAALVQARLNVEYTTVKAPITGRVGRADVTVGNVVTAGMQAPTLTTIQSINPIYVDFNLDEQSYLNFLGSRQNVGSMPVAIALANADTFTVSGTLTSVDNRLDPATGSLRARATVPNNDGTLLPGLFARVQVGTAQPQTVIAINDAALNTDQSKRFVYVVGADNKAHYREVQPGQMTGNLRVINSGLSGGEHIIVSGLMRVHPEAPVTPQMVDMQTLSPTTPVSGSAPVKG